MYNLMDVKPNEWIRVKDGLPEEGVRVLTIDMKSINLHQFGYRIDYIIKFATEQGFIWACRLQDEMDNVTHWMPLPELPEECLCRSRQREN